MCSLAAGLLVRVFLRDLAGFPEATPRDARLSSGDPNPWHVRTVISATACTLPPMHEPIAERGRRFRFAAGDILFHEGDATNGCYILVTGQLKVYAASEHGRE